MINLHWTNGIHPATNTHFRMMVITDAPDDFVFAQAAGELQRKLGGLWTTKIDGLDERYWDLQIDAVQLTLHSQHYVGISLYYSKFIDDEPSKALERAFALLAHGRFALKVES